MTAPSTARRSRMGPVRIMIIVVNYLNPIQRSNGQEVAWLALPVAWRLNHCLGIIATIPRATLASVFSLAWAGCRRIVAINLIPKGMGVVPPPIVHLVVSFVKHLPHIWVEGCPPPPESRTPAPTVRPHQLELWKVASRNWIKNNYIIKRSHALSSLMPQLLYINMGPQMCTEMNPFIWSGSNDRCRFITIVGICALAVELHILVSAGDGDVLYIRRQRCLVQSETEMSCMAGDGDVLYGRRRWCLVWPEMTVDCGTSWWHSAVLVR